MILHFLFYIVVTIIDKITQLIVGATGISISSTALTQYIQLIRGYITSAIGYLQIIFTETTWNSIITAMGTYAVLYPTYRISMLLIKKFMPNI